MAKMETQLRSVGSNKTERVGLCRYSTVRGILQYPGLSFQDTGDILKSFYSINVLPL